MNKTILPFSNETLWKILENLQESSESFLIDGRKSYDNIGKAMILYITNLGLKCDIDYTDLSYEERCEILDQYLSSLKICYIESLTHTLAKILLRCKQIDCESNSIFSNEETDRWINDHIDLCQKLVTFTDSCLLYLSRQCLSNPKVKDDLKEKYEVIQNRQYVPMNLVNVFALPDFTVYYSRIDKRFLKYFEYQFEEPMFNGHHLYDFIATEENFLAAYAILEIATKKD